MFVVSRGEINSHDHLACTSYRKWRAGVVAEEEVTHSLRLRKERKIAARQCVAAVKWVLFMTENLPASRTRQSRL